jgi:hypothetical protein
MKFIPDAIGRKFAQQGLLASQHSPQILFGAGVVGMVGSTILACRATLKLEGVLDEIEADKQKAKKAKTLVESGVMSEETTYTENEYRKDLTVISVRGVGNIAKLYAPSVLLGAASIAALSKSHNLLQERNLAITAAYAAVEGAFERYRERVIDRYGEDVDRDIRYESEEIDIIDDETGKVVNTTRAIDSPGSAYARFYDEVASRNWSPDPDVNLLFLRSVQTYCNDRLKARGHIFLNEVYDELGLSHTKAGSVVGWRWNKESGDDYVDFGIWDGTHEVVNDFFNGREGAILLDFNVDGLIYDKLDERDRGYGE